MNDNLFEENQPAQDEVNEHFDNLYDEIPTQDNTSQNNDVSVSDDIFEQDPVVEEKIEEIPEIKDITGEDKPQEISVQPKIEEEVELPL